MVTRVRYRDMRPVSTYRGAMRNASRGARHSLTLKAERKASGETRSQQDNRRRLEAEDRR